MCTEAKIADLQKTYKNNMFFVHFLNIRFCQEARKTTWKPLSISSKTTSKNESILKEISIILGIDYPMRDFDLLGKVLASISASISDHVGRKIHLKRAWKQHGKDLRNNLKKRAEIHATYAEKSL